MLVNSLVLLTAFTSFISWGEVFLIGLAVIALIYTLTPEPPAEIQVRMPPTLYYYLQWSWLGYIRLQDAFWPFFVIYNGVLLYIDHRVDEGAFTIASWVTAHIIMGMPLIYWTGAVWRCSANCASRYWAAAARWSVVAAYADLVLRWIIYHHFPNIMFNCQLMVIHWGDCS